MLDYLKNYKKLLELKETNQKEIQENKLLIDENLKKWIDETAKETNLNSELETLNEKYKETKEQKENRIVDVVGFISLSVSIITVLMCGHLSFIPCIIDNTSACLSVHL